MIYLLLFAFFTGTSFATAYFLGRKRQIGFKWSLFFSITLTPILGFIITMTSRRYSSEKPKPSLIKRIAGRILIGFAVLAFFGHITDDRRSSGPPIVKLMPIIGIAGLGSYVFKRGKGLNIDDELVKLG